MNSLGIESIFKSVQHIVRHMVFYMHDMYGTIVFKWMFNT